MLSILTSLLDVLFPPRCVSCGASGALLCSACRATIRVPAAPLCPDCGRSLAQQPSSAVAGATSSPCPFCAQGQRPAFLTCLRTASVYDGAARAAVLAFKYRGQRRLAVPLAELLAAAYEREGLRADLILPATLHAARRRARGYDQAELLARALSRRLGVPSRADLLVRRRDTRAQVSLSGTERRANVAGAFALAGPAAPHALAGKRILLIDDVTSTGSTLDAAAAALAAAHPAAIVGLAVARPTFESGDGVPEGMQASTPASARRASSRR